MLLHNPTSSIQSAIVTLIVSSEAASSERRFDRGITIASLKERLEPITGAAVASMKITLYNAKDEVVCQIDDDSKMLGYYPLQDYMRLH
ncbi:hypothetical protein HDU76_001129, partial [Blyttiomyces sp. JEL0837]